MFTIKSKIRSKTITDFNQAISTLNGNHKNLDLTLNFNNQQLTLSQIRTLSSTLFRNNIPRLVLKLRGNKLGLFAMKELTTIIEISPQGFSLDLSFNEIDDKSIIFLISALTSGFCPRGLSLDLTGNLIGDAGAKALANAITSPKWPLGLSIECNGNQINTQGCKALMEATRKYHPSGFYLGLDDNYIKKELLLEMRLLLKKNRNESLCAYLVMELMRLMNNPILNLILMYLLKEPQNNLEEFKKTLLSKFFPNHSYFSEKNLASRVDRCPPL